MKIIRFMALCGILSFGYNYAFSQNDVPTIEPSVNFFKSDGTEITDDNNSFDAPLEAHFRANPQNQGIYTSHYEWSFTREGETEPYLIRYEEDTNYTFTEAGTHHIVCYATFTNGNDKIEYTDEYWSERGYIKVAISESSLVMPNAFSPNGDKLNDIYKAKSYKSIVEFHAIIFNRWGQKLYEWNDPEDGWDGKYNGHDVKQGVYFVQVKATGSDGRKYNIRRAVNLLRDYYINSSSSSSEN